MKKLLILLLLLVIGCGTYIKQPVASHVVAVTLEGDTILVAIDKIRPNQYINFYPVYSRPYYQFYNPYYNPYYGNQYRFRYPDNRGISSSAGVKSEIKTPPPTGGTTYSPGSEKSISRIDYSKPVGRSKD